MQFICADGSAIERIPLIFAKRVEVPWLADDSLGPHYLVSATTHGYMNRELWTNLIRQVRPR